MKVHNAVNPVLVEAQLALAEEVFMLLDVMPAESHWFQQLSAQMLMFLEHFDGYLDSEVASVEALRIIELEMASLLGQARHLVHLAAETWRIVGEA